MKSKVCSICKKRRLIKFFCKNMASRDKLNCACKRCVAYRQACKPRTRQQQRHSDLKRQYGITLREYNDLLKKQKGGCALCGKTSKQQGKALAVDHNHKTNKIRGILCSKCNTGIGMLGDTYAQVAKAAKYLKESL